MTHLLNPVSSRSTHTPLATECGESEGPRVLPSFLKSSHLLILECKTNFQIPLVLPCKLTIEFTAVNCKTIASIAARAHELRYHHMKLALMLGQLFLNKVFSGLKINVNFNT